MLWLWLLLSAFAAANAFEFTIPNDVWENVRYYRNIDLSHPYVREHVLVEIKNVSPEPQLLYILPVNDGFDAVEYVAQYGAVLSDQDIDLQPIELNEGIYAIKFPFPIAPDSTVEFKAYFVFSNVNEPLPAKIGLDERQNLLLKTNKFCYSPYPTTEYSLAISGVSQAQEMEVPVFGYELTANPPELKGRADKSSGAITYGPIYAELDPYTVVPMGIMYDHNRPVTRVINLERSFWLPGSDVGIVLTEEYYELKNNGAGLKTGFSRAEWMKGRYEVMKDHFALSQLEFPIDNSRPFTNYYFTDKVGMVASHRQTHGHLVFQPRYPLFGGWSYNFTMGWNNNIDAFVRKADDEEDVYIGEFPLVNSVRDIYYDKVTISFYLPENAQFLNASAILPSRNVTIGSEMSYLDVSDGHVKVSLEFTHLIDELANSSIYVKYKYSSESYWSKVSKIAGFVFTGFVAYYLLGLVDLSIR